METLRIWTVSTLQRIYPLTPPPDDTRRQSVSLDLAINQRGSFQIALRQAGKAPQGVTLTAQPSEIFDIRIRRVGYVLLPHFSTNVPHEPEETDGIGMTPGYAPDPLLDEQSIHLPPHETHAFWITLTPRRAAVSGLHRIRITLTPETGQGHTCTVPVRLYPVALKPRQDFQVMQWFYVDALLDAYKCPDFNARFWQVLEAYFRNLTEHGQDTVYVPVFTPPLDGVKRPSQLLHVTRHAKNSYTFDWRDVKRYTDLARRCGIRHFEWTHLFTQWGVKNAIRIYHGQGFDEKRLWPPSTGAVAPVYRAFLATFLPEFHRFLKAERMLGCSFFHLSDEPHGAEHRANYSQARALLAALAPWMTVTDALSEVAFGHEGLTDLPIASISTALDFIKDNIPCGCYYCCSPRDRFLNRFIDTPLPKIGMNGWLFYRWPFRAFLHWGYNYWYRSQTREMIDPYQISDAHQWPGWSHGDPFLVYPGPDGPVDSIRWEIFAESLGDYALLQTLKVERHDPLLRPLRSFEDFPKTGDWIPRTRRQLLRRASRT